MKTFFQSMAGRVFLILLVGILASASLTWWLASSERQRAIGQLRENRSLEQAEQFIATLDAIPAAGRPAFLATARRFGLKVDHAQPPAATEPATGPASSFVTALQERLGTEFQLTSLPKAQSDCLAALSRRPEAKIAMIRNVCETLQVRLRDNSQVRLTVLPPRMPIPPPRPESFAYLGLFLISVAILAFIVSRMAVRPLRQLAQAAEDLGNNIDHPPLQEQGTNEIRQATAAFNAMQARIRDHIRQRTQMLAAITHDLQTPLTRLRLRLEKIGDAELRAKLIEDLSHTQIIVREGLDLARSMDAAEPMQPLDIDSLLDSVCSDAADAGQPVSFSGSSGLSVMARPMALRRCLNNLIDNAVKYGQQARVTIGHDNRDGIKRIAITVRDNGPGIPDEELRKVFEPFYRIESSRSRDTGGTGLGLTIARSIAQQHGGDIELMNMANGGLQATMLLPLRSGT